MKAYGLLAVLWGISPSYASDDPPILVAHFEPLHSVTLDEAAPRTQQKARRATPLTLKFDALGQSFELDLEPNDRLLSQAARQALPDDIALYRGGAGKPGSWARIVIADGTPRGLIWDGEQMIVIEAPGDSSVQSAVPVVYRLADAYVTPGSMTCGASTTGGSAAAMYTKLVAELAAAQAAAPGATSEIRLSAIGDFEFADRVGTNADAAIVTRLNNVDGIFSEQLGVQITVAALEVHSDEDDPFSDTPGAGDLLDELGIYRRETPLHRSHGLTHLYTGRNLNSTTVGIAYVNSLCSPRFGAGLTEGRHGASFDSLITAHEIGHNFGAPHDAEEGSACVAESDHFIMAPSVNGSNQFSRCSIAQMAPNVAAAQCITPLPTVDMTVSADDPASGIMLGDEVVIPFTVSNVGTLPASNVSIEIGMTEERLAFVAAEALAGTCSSGAGNVTCQFDTIPEGSSRTATLTATAAQTGDASVFATVFSDDDSNPDNDSVSLNLQIVAAVNLGVNTLPLTRVELNQSTSVSVSMDNRSTLNATGVEVRIALGGGLTANSADWSLGTCSVSPQQVDCEGSSFPAQGSATVDFSVTGTASGQHSYTVTVSSAEDDTDGTDNSGTGTVSVDAVSSGVDNDGGGGGGPVDPLFLWLLNLAAVIACQREFAANKPTSTRY